MAGYGTSGDHLGCIQCGSRAAAARDSGLPGRPGTVGERDRGCAGDGAAGGIEAAAGAAGSRAGADAERGTAQAVPNQRRRPPPAARLDERIRAVLAAHADEREGARGGQDVRRREGEITMSMAQDLMGEFEEQAPLTRKFLERLPEEKLGWKPHQKSLTAGQLALHLAQVPGSVARLVRLNPAQFPGVGGPTAQPARKGEILEAHDEGMAAVRLELLSHSDSAMQELWQLQVNGQALLTMPRGKFIRDIML